MDLPGETIIYSGVQFQYFALRFSFGSVVWKTAVSVFVSPNRGFGSVLFFFLFCSQLSASATQRTMNGFLCFNALQRWLSACVNLLMLIRSLNYTFNRDTRHSHDEEINCNCVWQCFINIYCLSDRPKNTHFFVRVSFSNVMNFEWFNDSLDVWVHWSFVRYSWWMIDCLSWVMTYDLNELKLGT